MSHVVLSSLAQNDLDEVCDYVGHENKNPTAADQLIDDFDEAFQLIAEIPKMGTAVDELANGCFRFVVRKRYLI